MEHSNQFLGTERIGKLMKQYAVPCIISLLVGALYNIVDQIFIANASYLGSYGNAANTVVFPLTVIALAIAVMVLACVNKACFIFLQAIGTAAASTFLSMVREIVFGVGFALLLPVYWGLDGVLYSMPLSDILTFIIAAFLIVGTYKELKEVK